MSQSHYNSQDDGNLFNQSAQQTFNDISDDAPEAAEELQQSIIEEARKQLLD